jgi:predicted metalloendopeptidase
MLRGITALGLLLVLGACTGEPAESRSGLAETTADTSIGSANWIDLDAMDRKIRPADNFYSFVNGQWSAQTEIPRELPWISPYVENYFEVRRRLEEIIAGLLAQTSQMASDGQRVGDLYRSYMDLDAIERIGIQALQPILNQVDSISTAASLAVVFADFNRQHFRLTDNANKYTAPFSINARPDDRDATRMVAIVEPAGLGMSTRQSYVSTESRQAEVRAQYSIHVERILTLAGIPDAAASAVRIVELEIELAEASLTLTQLTDHETTYNRLSQSELKQLLPAFDWAAYLARAGLAEHDAFLVLDVAYFERLNDMLLGTSFDDWSLYLTWQLLRIYSPFLTDEFVQQDFAFFGRVELGNEVPTSREELAVIVVEQAFSEIMSRLYVERYFTEDEKQHVTEMAESIRSQFHQSIRELDWMSDATKRAAIRKLEKIDIKVGYPDVWHSYDGVAIDSEDLIGNLMSIAQGEYRQSIDSLASPVDRSVWQTPAYASSAYYSRVRNEIAIPAGYLLPPWYDRHAEPAMNFGGIGTVIGHEMGHAFDNQGSQYDGDGNLVEWWSEDDHERFLQRTDRLVEQYDRFSPAPGQFVDGELTLSENIGDLTGLTMGYRAFRSASSPDVSAGEFTSEQRFFISYVSHWRALYSDALLSRILTGDGHAPQAYRANGPLLNFSPFYEAFSVMPGDGMFLQEEDRVSIW